MYIPNSRHTIQPRLDSASANTFAHRQCIPIPTANSPLFLSSPALNSPEFFHAFDLVNTTTTLITEIHNLLHPSAQSSLHDVVRDFEVILTPIIPIHVPPGLPQGFRPSDETLYRQNEHIYVKDLANLKCRFAYYRNGTLQLIRLGRHLQVNYNDIIHIQDLSYISYEGHNPRGDYRISWDPKLEVSDDPFTDESAWLQFEDHHTHIESFIPLNSHTVEKGRQYQVNVFGDSSDPFGCHAITHTHPSNSVASALLVNRGECTFLDKAKTALKAGYDLVIVLDENHSEPIRPIIDPSALFNTELANVLLVPSKQPLHLVKLRSNMTMTINRVERRKRRLRFQGVLVHNVVLDV